MNATIYAHKYASLAALVSKINARAERMGWGKIALRKSSEPYWKDSEKHFMGVEVVDVEIDEATMRFEGWRFVASIEHTESGNIVSSFGADVSAEYRTADCRCDHCKANRRRSQTYIIRHEDGSEMQVGSTCINDFLRGHNAAGYAAMLEALFLGLVEARESDDVDEYGRGGGRKGFNIVETLAVAACLQRTKGYVSSKRHDETQLPRTSDLVFTYLTEVNLYKKEIQPVICADDSAFAERTLAWVRSESFAEQALEDRKSDYRWNLHVACADDYVTSNRIGIVCSAVAALKRSEDEQREFEAKVAQSTSEFIGAIGERRVFKLCVEKHLAFEGFYGVTHLYKMRDAGGNLVTWWASSAQDFDEDDVVSGKGTVKLHDVDKYSGEKQTTITRCKLSKD